MDIDPDVLRRYAAELERIGISEEASRYFGVSGSGEEAIAELQEYATGLGTDGFFRETCGVDFATWRANMERELKIPPPPSNDQS